MLGGYYNGHHFGAPVLLSTSGNHITVVGGMLEKVIWPYLIKWVLTSYAVRENYSHIKSAALADGQGSISLIMGRGGGGKTVFLTEACARGNRFMTNTHTLLRDNVAHAVPSAIRIRRTDQTRALETASEDHHIDKDGFLVAPSVAFAGPPVSQGPVAQILLINHTGKHRTKVTTVGTETATAFLEQFGLAISTYTLRHDLLGAVSHDLEKYARVYMAQKQRLVKLIEMTPCFEVDADLYDAGSRKLVLRELGLVDKEPLP